MKKILFAAFAASLLAAGCQKTEVYQPANSGEKMTFSTEMKKITKADPSAAALGNANLEAQGFNVWAFADYDVTNSTNVGTNGIYDGIENLHVTYDDADLTDDNPGWWNPGKEYYWPGKDKKLRFYAVSAATQGETKTLKYAVTINAHRPIANPGAETPTYELTVSNFQVNPSTPNEDLMVADFITQDQSDKTVDLNFHHTLAKVEFLFKTATSEADEAKQPKVYVQQIKVSDMTVKGTLNVTPSTEAPLTAPSSFNWSLGEETADKAVFTTASEANDIGGTLDYLEEDEYTTAKGLKLTPTITAPDGTATGETVEPASFATWLMLPQTLTDKKVEIIYVINNRQFKAIFPLSTNEVSAWAVNSYTKYTVSLLPNLISFTANTQPWTPTNEIDHVN